MDWTKEQRAAWFSQACKDAGYRDWGKAQHLADDLKVTHATTTGWLSGALPRDHDEIKRVADFLGIDILEWIYGEKSTPKNIKPLLQEIYNAVFTVKMVELSTRQEEGHEDYLISPKQFVRLVRQMVDGGVEGMKTMLEIAEAIELNNDNGGEVVNGPTCK